MRASRLFLAFFLLLAVCCQALASSGFTGKVTVQGPAAAVAPISGATVTVLSKKQVVATATTDASGRYLITGLAPGLYSLKFSHNGYSDGVLNDYDIADSFCPSVNAGLTPNVTVQHSLAPQSGPGNRIWNVSNPHAFPVTFSWNLARASGTQTAPPGQSTFITTAADVALKIFFNGYAPGTNTPADEPTLTGNISGTASDAFGNALTGVSVSILDSSNTEVALLSTASNGTYDAINLPAGTYSVTFSVPLYQSQTTNGVVVQSGLTTQVDATMILLSGSISGVVTDALTNEVLNGATVSLVKPNNDPVASTFTGADGSYNFPSVAPGDYSLNYTYSGYNPGSQPVTVAALANSVKDYALQPSPGAITGIVTNVANAPLSGVAVQLLDGNGQFLRSTTTAADGSYSFTALQPGEDAYQLRFSKNTYETYLVSPISVAPGGTTPVFASLELVKGNLVGVVGNGYDLLPGATVSLFDSQNTLLGQVTVGDTAAFSFSGITPGVVKLVGALPNYNNNEQSLTILPGSTHSRNITLSVASGFDTVNGRVTTNTNPSLPIAGAAVKFYDSDGTLVYTAHTDASGNYFSGPLTHQWYGLIFSKAGYTDRPLTADFPAPGVPTELVLNQVMLPGENQTGTLFVSVNNTNGVALGGVTAQYFDLITGQLVHSATNNSPGQTTGRFSATIPLGLYKVVATCPGFETHTGIFRPFTPNFNQGGTFVMQTGEKATVNVTVVDGVTGQLVPDSHMTLTVNTNPGGYYNPTLYNPPTTLISDAQGKVTFTNVLPGYTWSVNGVWYLPGTTTIARQRGTSGPRLQPGITSATLTFTAAGLFGTVRNSTQFGPVIPGALVELLDGNGNVINSQISAANGNFIFTGLPYGNYSMRFSAAGFVTMVSPQVFLPQPNTPGGNYVLLPVPP